SVRQDNTGVLYVRARAGEPGHRRPITLVVPIYDGYDETMACLESVVRSVPSTEAEVLCIYDCGPKPRILRALREMHARGAFGLVENEENKGFLATVNAAIESRPHNDIIILNADTVVPLNWIERLRKAAYSEVNVASATPFSNNATILS